MLMAHHLKPHIWNQCISKLSGLSFCFTHNPLAMPTLSLLPWQFWGATLYSPVSAKVPLRSLGCSPENKIKKKKRKKRKKKKEMIDPEDLKIRYCIFVYDTYKIHRIEAGTWSCANLPCTRLTPHPSTAWISDYSPVCSPDQRRASTACSRRQGPKPCAPLRIRNPVTGILKSPTSFLHARKGTFPEAMESFLGRRMSLQAIVDAADSPSPPSTEVEFCICLCVCVCLRVFMCLSLSLSLSLRTVVLLRLLVCAACPGFLSYI